MSSSAASDQAPLTHVLVLAPYRRDADYLQKLLEEHEIAADACTSCEDIATRLADRPGVMIATHEASTPAVLSSVAQHLTEQPAWSEMPIIVLLDRTSNQAKIRAELAKSWPRARHLYYERPVTPVEIVSGVQSALLARLRQRDVRDHLDRELELRRELNHRVKNIIASVASIFEMTARGATSVQEFATTFRGRLAALANVHSAVFEARGEEVSIQEVVDLTLGPYRLPDENRFDVGGPLFMFNREAATTLALCLHELATNAVKYGALSVPTGSVVFQWQLTEDDSQRLSIKWHERDGPPVKEPERTGYGTRYLRSALGNLFGQIPRISFESDGLQCEVSGSFPRFSCNPSA